ncbi:ROK family protein [Leifsonia sp. L25]|uniref:ROK family protein n=1 Tax=Leifsonia sp. L25 TaxID=3423957 RepID=UPI003D688D7B
MSGTTVAGALADEQGDRSATPGSDSPVALAVDLGGTAMKGAVVAEGGEVVAELTRPTPGRDILDALVALFHDLRGVAAAAGREVVGAGVATPGMLDEQRGIVHYASNLDWRDVPLHDILRGSCASRSRSGTMCAPPASRNAPTARRRGRTTSSSSRSAPASPPPS